MVDVSGKDVTIRTARASAVIVMSPKTMDLIRDKQLTKGDVSEIARLAGIMAAKRTSDLIPLCHPLSLDSAQVDISELDSSQLRIESTVTVQARTGVEMEALTAVTVAALTVYDMCKSVDREIKVERIQLEEKMGGKSGHFIRKDASQ